MIDFRKLVEKGVHFGHQTSRWCPKMEPYIWGHKNKTHLIDVSKTAFLLEKAARFLEDIASKGQSILWVGTKRSAQDVVAAVAQELSMPRVTHRWVGGTLTNKVQVGKSVTKLLHYEDILQRADQFTHYTKKEISVLNKKLQHLNKIVGGIRNLSGATIGAVVLVDIDKERAALCEAVQMNVPVVAIVDTNADPSLVAFPIPGNDDAQDSIAILMHYLKDAVARGKATAAANKIEAAEGKAAQKPQEDTMIEVAGVLSLVSQEEEAAGTSTDAKKQKKAPVSAQRTAAPRKKTTREGDE